MTGSFARVLAMSAFLAMLPSSDGIRVDAFASPLHVSLSAGSKLCVQNRRCALANKSRHERYLHSETRLGSSPANRDSAGTDDANDPNVEDGGASVDKTRLSRFIEGLGLTKRPPPFLVEDTNLLFYDVFLLINLSLSISFWVVHRMSFSHIGTAISEGSLLCILWIAAGLYNGAFLYSAVDGHYDITTQEGQEKGGPKAAGLLGLTTFVGAANLRIVVALVEAIIEHRRVGTLDGEELIPLEVSFGLLLMSVWRALHSTYVAR